MEFCYMGGLKMQYFSMGGLENAILLYGGLENAILWYASRKLAKFYPLPILKLLFYLKWGGSGMKIFEFMTTTHPIPKICI